MKKEFKDNSQRSLFNSVTSAVLAVSVLGMVLNCAPKKSSENKAPLAKTDVSPTDSAVSLVNGVNFSTLEKSQKENSSIHAVYADLKKGQIPSDEILVLAIAQQHLKDANGGKPTESKETELSGQLGTIAKEIHAKTPEMLREVYGNLEKKNNRKTKKGTKQHNIQAALNENEISSYSAPVLLSLLWLKSSAEVSTAKAVIVITESEISLGELRTNNEVVTFDPAIRGDEIKNLGKVEKLIEDGKTRIITLKNFLVHEVMKEFAGNKAEFANRIISKSAKELGLKLKNTSLVPSNIKTDSKKIQESALFFNQSIQLSEGDVETRMKPTPNPAPTPTPAPAPGAPTPAPTPAPAPGAAPATPALETLLDLQVNGQCVTRDSLRKILTAKERSVLYAVVKEKMTDEKLTPVLLGEKEGQMIIVNSKTIKPEDAKKISDIDNKEFEKIKELRNATVTNLKLDKDKDIVYLIFLTRNISATSKKSEVFTAALVGEEFKKSQGTNISNPLVIEELTKIAASRGNPEGKEKDQVDIISLQLFTKGRCATK